MGNYYRKENYPCDRKKFSQRRGPPRMSSSSTQSQVCRQEFDWTQTTPSVAVAYTIAALENTDVMEVTPLYEYVDPQSLDSLVADSAEIAVSFTAYGYTIQLTNSAVVIKNS